jgi:hypothetical protein
MWGNGSSTYPYPVQKIDSGKCYRIRFIVAAGTSNLFRIQMENHKLTVVCETYFLKAKI